MLLAPNPCVFPEAFSVFLGFASDYSLPEQHGDANAELDAIKKKSSLHTYLICYSKPSIH